MIAPAAVAAVALSAPAAHAQDMNPADGEGLVVDYPVFQPVQPPRGYQAAIQMGTRGVDGRPGPRYWQQWVDYDIDVRLDPETALLTGSETITVRNDTPYDRAALVLRLYQNVFAEGSPRGRSVTLNGGMTLDRLAVGGVDLEALPPRRMFGPPQRPENPGYQVNGTLAAIFLPEPLTAGGTLELQVEWSFTVSGGGGFRMGHLDHEVFNLAQWYPQVAVFDDVFGQDQSPYLGEGEFYNSFGDFRVDVTVPEGWIVVGSGMLTNPDEVLHPEAVRLLASAAALDTVVEIVSVADREAGQATIPSDDGWHIWSFEAETVRDFAFAAGGTYVWHATGAETGHEQDRALIQNVFDPAREHWSEGTLFAKHSIEFFSDYVLPYPYPQATAAMGPPEVSGMEYPMITFITHTASGQSLHETVAHELSHFWMPMIIGNKEMSYAWMDEGLTVYNTSLAMADYYDTPVTRPGDEEMYHMVVQMEWQESIMHHMDHAEHMFGSQVGAYSKPGMLLHTLRHMMGPDRFDAAYRDYAATWAFKHPMPWDFFAMMSDAAGTDLDWFWQPWFHGTDTLDQGLDEVVPGAGSAEITVSNLSSGVMPVELALEYADGSSETVVWPASVWAGTRTTTGTVPTSGDLRKVTIDADGYYPDLDRSNNEWEAVDG
jgi:hypothetical protein